MDRHDRPAPGRDLVERTSSHEGARVNYPDDGLPAGCRGRATLTVAAVVAVVGSLQEKKPRGARFAEILAVLGPAYPSLTASCLRRELAPVLKRAVGSHLLHCDLQRNYTVLRRHKTHVDPDVRPARGGGPTPAGPDPYLRRQLQQRRQQRQPRGKGSTSTASRARRARRRSDSGRPSRRHHHRRAPGS